MMTQKNKKIKIAILASGGGSNAASIMEYFSSHEKAEVKIVLTNRSNAGVLDKAKIHQVNSLVFDASKDGLLLKLLNDNEIDFVVLAGYLKKIPDEVVRAYPNKMVNIHPSLLPKFGGKGMYGHHVHEAVVAAHEKESGMTIHYVNEVYDEGTIIEQHKCVLEPSDTAEMVGQKVLKLEHKFFAPCIEKLINNGI